MLSVSPFDHYLSIWAISFIFSNYGIASCTCTAAVFASCLKSFNYLLGARWRFISKRRKVFTLLLISVPIGVVAGLGLGSQILKPSRTEAIENYRSFELKIFEYERQTANRWDALDFGNNWPKRYPFPLMIEENEWRRMDTVLNRAFSSHDRAFIGLEGHIRCKRAGMMFFAPKIATFEVGNWDGNGNVKANDGALTAYVSWTADELNNVKRSFRSCISTLEDTANF